MPIKIDLHTHTKYSDGFYTPQELLQIIQQQQIYAFAITDHDTTDAIPYAQQIGNELGIEVVPGVELSSLDGDLDLHILGYFIDIENKKFKEYLQLFKTERLKRAEKIIAKLNSLGISISLDDVLNLSQSAVVGRPHIAEALVKMGAVNNFQGAFQKLIGNTSPAYEKKYHISPEQAIRIIHQAGGLAVIAHPGLLSEGTINNLIKVGVDGFEAYHPSHSVQQIKYYEGIASNYFLYATGGSDFHGGTRSDASSLGRYYTPLGTFESMKRKASEINLVNL